MFGRPGPRRIRLSPLLLAGVVVPVLLAACGSPASPPAATVPAAPLAAVAPLGVHVVHPTSSVPYLADAAGRQVLLRGVDDNALVQYAADYPEAPDVGPSDLAEMAALGFNFLRLPVSWSEIMPEPGRIDQAYLDRVAQVVGWARAHGIGVLVDMHEDNYSLETYPDHEADGAPAWAVVDGGTPCTPDVSTTTCSLAAFANFWSDVPVDGTPIQQWYLEAMTAVARAAGATSATSDVVGVELMNEPWPAGPAPFEQTSLYPFYDRMISGLRAAGIVTPLWFEPSLLRNVTDSAVAAADRFSSDPDLVYAVHIYSGVFSPPSGPSASLGAMDTSYANAATEAAAFDAPFVVDEYGSSATPAWDDWLRAQLEHQNAYQAGSAFWLWKQRTGSWDNWAVVHLDGSLRSTTQRAQLLGAPHVDAVPGHLAATIATADRLTATVDGSGGTATLWGGAVVVHGGPTVTVRTLRQVTVNGKPTPAACRTVAFATGSVGLAGCLLTVRVPAGYQVVVATP